MTDVATRPLSRWKEWAFRVALAIVFVVCAVAEEVTLRLKGRRPWNPEAGKLDQHVEGPAGALFALHPTLAYALQPGTFTVKQRLVTWTATNLDAMHRTTRPGDAPTATGDEIWIFGDSNSYGWGINDDQTYSWLIQKKHPELGITNFAIGGYSTLQSLIQIDDALSGGAKPPKLAVLAYASYHDGRNALLRGNRKFWIPYMSRHPVFPRAWLDNGELRYGLEKLEYTAWPLQTHSALVNFLEETYNEVLVLTSHAADVSRALIGRFRDRCRDSGVEFVLAGISKDARTAAMLAWAREQGMKTIDISVDQSNPENVVPGDGHPGVKAHAIYASRLEEILPEAHARTPEARPTSP